MVTCQCKGHMDSVLHPCHVTLELLCSKHECSSCQLRLAVALTGASKREATEDENMAAEPNYAFAKGYGRFGTGYIGQQPRLAILSKGTSKQKVQ